MTLSGRPLLDNRVDAELFVDRDAELTRLHSALNRGLNVLVAGDPGIGKTSLLNALRHQRRTPPADDGVDADGRAAAASPVVYVRAEGVTDGAELLARIAATVEEAVTDAAPVDAKGSAPSAVLARLEALTGGESGIAAAPIVIVDDVCATAGHALFGRLRDELWSMQWRWVVAARSADRGGLTMPPADAFFEEQLVLAPFADDAAGELLRRRLPDWSSVAIADVVDTMGGNPRDLLNAVRTVGDSAGQVMTVLAAIRRRDDAIARAGRPEAMVAAALRAMGAASASDDELLDRLGWTRARAVQVLTHMEQLGLVRSDDVKLGRGRPRKVYRLATPAEFEMSQGHAKISS